MEKLLNSLRALCLSTFTVSRWVDNPQNQRGGRQGPLCQVVPCPTFPRAGGACTAPTAMEFSWAPPPHTPPMECELPRKANLFWRAMVTGGSQKPGVEATTGSLLGQLTCVLPTAWPQGGRARLPTERLKSHSHLLHETTALGLTTSTPLFASELAPVLRKAMVQDREAESAGCVI